MPERDELKSELARMIDRLMEMQEQLAQPEPPPPPPPKPRTWKPRVIKGGLAAIAAFAPVAFVRSHLGATGVAAVVSAGLMLTPSLAPHVTEVPEPPSMALPSPTEQPPPLEPRPGPPTTEPAPVPDTPEDTVPDTVEPDAAPETSNPPDPPDAAAPAPEGGADNEPDTTPGSPPPEDEPREPPPAEEPEPQPEPEQPPGRTCSLVHVDLDAVEACLLPE